MAQKTWLGTSSTDYSVTGNWSEGAIPTTNDTVTISRNAIRAIQAGLNQSSVAIDNFTVEDGFSYDIGTSSAFLQISCTGSGVKYFKYAGGGSLAKIDLGASAVAPIVTKTGSPSTGDVGLSVKGTAMTGFVVTGGIVGIGVEPNDTTTEVTSINVIPENVGGASVTIGKYVADTAGNLIDLVTLDGGICYNYSSADAVDSMDGTYHQLDGRFTAGDFRGSSKLFIVANDGAATFTSIDMHDQSSALCRGVSGTQTVTTLALHGGSRWDEGLFGFTYTNAIQTPDGLESVTLILGKNIKVVPSAI